MRSAFKIYLSLHTQISRAEKQMRLKNIRKKEASQYLYCFGIDKLDGEKSNSKELKDKKNIGGLIGGAKSLPSDACILLKGERGTHKFALASNYLFQGLRLGENVVLFNMGPPVEIARIPQYKNENRIYFEDENIKEGRLKEKGDFYKNFFHYIYDYRRRPPEGKYKLTWWVSQECNARNGSCDCFNKGKIARDILLNHANLFIYDFDAGFLLPEEFISTFIDLSDWIENECAKSKHKLPIDRILLNSTSQIRTRFPVIDDEPFLMPAFIRLSKCLGISTMIIDVVQSNVETNRRMINLDALSDLILTLENNWEGKYKIINESGSKMKAKGESEALLKIVTADNITGKVYEKSWIGLWIFEEQDTVNRRELIFEDIQKTK